MLQKSPMYAYIPATDVARARQFYEQKLGFKPTQERPNGVIYEFARGTACFLYETQHAGTSKASQAFWQVEDIQAEVTELKSLGVRFERYEGFVQDEKGIFREEGPFIAWFKDPAGNVLSMLQER